MAVMNFFDALKETLVQWILLLAAWVLLSRLIGTLWVQLIEVKQIPLFEKKVFGFLRIDPEESHSWRSYGAELLKINLLVAVWLFLLLKFQNYFPFLDKSFSSLSFYEAFNVTVSFMTQTNWQTFSLQERVAAPIVSLGIFIFQFLAPATGIAVAFAWMRSFLPGGKLGNPAADILRIIFYVLLPISLLYGTILISQGALQNFSQELSFTSLEGNPGVLTQGPFAAFQAIALVGNNGGGLLTVNFSHPYANPTAWTHWLGACLAGGIPASFLYAFGEVVGMKAKGHVRLLWIVSFGLLFLIGLALLFLNHADLLYENRLGVPGSEVFSAVSIATGTGANSLDFGTFSAIGQWILMLLIQVGQLIFGSTGVGFCNILFLVIFGVFLGGLMIGKTPQYFGKKIELTEILWMALGLMGTSFLIIFATGLWTFFQENIGGPKAFMQLLYAISSCSYNNGSSVGGTFSSSEYHLFFGLLMLAGRLIPLVAALGLAGSFVTKKNSAEGVNDLPLSGLWFGCLYVTLMIISTALIYLPMWFLGPCAMDCLNASALTAGLCNL